MDCSNRVSNGAAWLDRYVPNWYRCIDPDKLNIANGQCCALGQLFGTYEEGAKKCGIIDGDAAMQLGFLHTDGNDNHMLNRIWRMLIRARTRQPETA